MFDLYTIKLVIFSEIEKYFELYFLLNFAEFC